MRFFSSPGLVFYPPLFQFLVMSQFWSNVVYLAERSYSDLISTRETSCIYSSRILAKPGGFFFFLICKNFCWTKVHFVGPLIAPILDIVWLSPWVSKPGWFSCLHTCLHTVNLWVMSGATPAFSTNRSVHCKACIYQACLPDIPHASSGGQPMVDANLGSSVIRSRDIGLSPRQANALSTRPRRLANPGDVWQLVNQLKKTFLWILSQTKLIKILL